MCRWLSATGFTHKMPKMVAIMMINMISNSFCTDALPDGRVIVATVPEVFHARAVHALIRVKDVASFVWKKRGCKPLAGAVHRA